MAPAVKQITNSVPISLRQQENIGKTQTRLEEENGEKVNKTENNLGSALNRFNSQPNETSTNRQIKTINFEQNSTPILSKNNYLTKIQPDLTPPLSGSSAMSPEVEQITKSVLISFQDKYKNEFSEQSLISCGGFGIVYEVIHKYSKKIYAIKKIALNEKESEKTFKELNLMNKLKSRYVVKHIDSWIEENHMKIEDFTKTHSSSGISYSHPIFDPKKKVLLHIQMEFCCQTLNKVMEQLSNKMKENDSQMMKTLCYFICCELLSEIIECVHYLHRKNVIHRDLKPANILLTEGINGRFVKLGDF
ncbi:unnamed protein product, partial [Sphagnum jensenii]